MTNIDTKDAEFRSQDHHFAYLSIGLPGYVQQMETHEIKVKKEPGLEDMETKDDDEKQASSLLKPQVSRRPTTILDYLAHLDTATLLQLYKDTFTCLTIFR